MPILSTQQLREDYRSGKKALQIAMATSGASTRGVRGALRPSASCQR